jgi:hypothetical protein
MEFLTCQYQEIGPWRLVLEVAMSMGTISDYGAYPGLNSLYLRDLFDVVKCATIFPTDLQDPATYPPGEVLTIDHESTIDDVCDFIVQYINSDVLVNDLWLSRTAELMNQLYL